MTYSILRKNYPALALEIRNITGNSDSNSALFKVRLGQGKVVQVVDALARELESITSPGMVVMAKAMLGDWLRLLAKLNLDLDTPDQGST